MASAALMATMERLNHVEEFMLARLVPWCLMGTQGCQSRRQIYRDRALAAYHGSLIWGSA